MNHIARRRRLATAGGAALAAAALLAACAAPGAAPGGTPGPQETAIPGPDRGGPILTPDLSPPDTAVEAPADGLERALAQLPDIVADIQERTGVPGIAVSVVHGGETVFADGYGVRRLGEDAEVDADTVFPIASMSKPIGSTVIARLVSEGKAAWTDRIVDLMPWFRLSDPAVTQMLTVGDLYSHRSGLPAAEGDLLEDLGYDRRYILEHLALAPLSPFRISYAYANYGMTAGAEAVAESLGESWEDLSEEYLYAPLGMTSTSSRFSDLESRTNRAAQHALTEEGAFAPLYTREPDAQSPAGGVSSSVNDLAKWMALILADGGDLISADALLPAVTPQVVSAPAGDPATRTGFYGYGWNVSVQPGGRVQLGHSGAFLLGTGTNVAMIPSLDVGITVLTNAAPIGAAEAIAASFLDIVQYGSITRDWYEAYHGAFGHYFETSTDLAGKTRPDGPLPDVQRDLGPLFGTYQNDYYGPIQVGWQGDGAGTAGNVIVGMGPGFETQFVLEHWSGDTFALEPGGENALPGDLSSVVFDVGQDGHGTVTIQYFDRWPGQGVWTR